MNNCSELTRQLQLRLLDHPWLQVTGIVVLIWLIGACVGVVAGMLLNELFRRLAERLISAITRRAT